jgi:hypothetical protein
VLAIQLYERGVYSVIQELTIRRCQEQACVRDCPCQAARIITRLWRFMALSTRRKHCFCSNCDYRL